MCTLVSGLIDASFALVWAPFGHTLGTLCVQSFRDRVEVGVEQVGIDPIAWWWAWVNEEFDRVKEVIRADLLARGYDGLTALPPPQFNTSYQDSVDRPRR